MHEKRIPECETEGIKYAGSKREIIPAILAVAKVLGARSVLDGFSGTTRVSQAFARAGLRVCANDVAAWSKVFGTCYLLNRKTPDHYQPLLGHLNALPGVDGWFTEHYGGSARQCDSDSQDGRKKIWQLHNTRKLDAIRTEIDRLARDEIEKAVLLTSLILALDKVDSTLGHQASYLKKWSPRSYRTLKLEVPRPILSQDAHHTVLQRDILEVAPAVEADVAYFDPPYGSCNEKMPPSRIRYAAYYHLWTTLCLNDQPKLVGAANRRADASDKVAYSVFEDFRKNARGRFLVLEAIERLIRQTKAPFVVLSYSNEGRATRNELVEVLHDNRWRFAVVERRRRSHVMKAMRWTFEWTKGDPGAVTEYLFVISKAGCLPDLSGLGPLCAADTVN